MKEQFKWLADATEYMLNNKALIFFAVALGISGSLNMQYAKQEPIVKEVEKIVEKPILVNVVSKYGNEFTCVDTSKMYTIKKETVESKGVKKTKHARGLELENGYSLYITEFTPTSNNKSK